MFQQLIFVVFSLFSLKTDYGHSVIYWGEIGIFDRYKNLLVDIREQRKSPIEAKAEFKLIIQQIKEAYPNQMSDPNTAQMIFPLVGSNVSAVGGKGKGYYVRNFDLFDHSVTGSHPAHDIFIFDPDQDCIDNRRNSYVDIVSVGYGLVVATENNWTDSSEYRGGNYVWVYDLERGGLWYYAHHRKVDVEPGQLVSPGDKLGEVGRTGFNAKNNRSDTHLHLMYLNLDENLDPHPLNYYEWLKEAQTIKTSKKATSEGLKKFGNLKLKKISSINYKSPPLPLRFALKIKS